MEKLAITSATSILFLLCMFMLPGNGWAVASYAQKHGLGCKSCHAFGSELNTLGKSFKKNGHSFGEKNAPQKDLVKQGTPKVENSAVSKVSAGSPARPDTVNNAKEAGPTDAIATPEAEQQPPESKIFKWRSDDGTLNFSDRLYVNPRDEKKPVADQAGKKNRKNRLSPLSAIVPKRFQKPAIKTVNKKTEPDVVTRKNSIVTPETGKNFALPESFERCMEQIIVAYPSPKTPEVAMEQFKEAETICTPAKKHNR